MRPTSCGFNYRQVLTVLYVGYLARYLFVLFMPPEARSNDTYTWETIINSLLAGQNPYHEAVAPDWPPLWMQLLYSMTKAAGALQVPFITVLRVFLAGVESLVVVALFRLIRQIDPQVRPYVPILVGIALNPIAIFQICQHGNFDVLVGLWLLLFVGQLVQYHRSHLAVDWLAACLFLGLGILTKTVPLVLCPMLAGGWRRVDRRAKLIGLALAFGPVALGMSIIYVLAPAEVTANVLFYRSASGWFGISGLLHLAGADSLIRIFNLLFYVLLAGAGAWVASVFWRRERIEPREIILCAALFLMAIPGIGPGYASQYQYWFLPLLIATYLLYDGPWRRILLAFGVVAVVTSLLEYAVLPSHGRFLRFIILARVKTARDAQVFMPAAVWIDRLATQQGQVLFRLPLFVMFLVVLSSGVLLFFRKLRAEPAPDGASRG